jgi:uncharacterized integral membrane protein
MNHLKVVLIVLFSLLVIILAAQNNETLSTSVSFRLNLIFLRYESPSMSLYFMSAITFLIGFLLAGLLGITERFRLKGRIKTLQRASKEKDKELNSLRNLPVTAKEFAERQRADNNKTASDNL